MRQAERPKQTQQQHEGLARVDDRCELQANNSISQQKVAFHEDSGFQGRKQQQLTLGRQGQQVGSYDDSGRGARRWRGLKGRRQRQSNV